MTRDAQISARVYRHPDSPFWRARFKAWDQDRGEWRWQTLSTKLTDEAAALTLAREYARMAALAAPGEGRVKLTRAEVEKTVESILRTAGVTDFNLGVTLATWIDNWIEMKSADDTCSKDAFRRGKLAVLDFVKWAGQKRSLPLASISAKMVTAWRDSMMAAGLSSKTVKHRLSFVSMAFSRAVAEGLIARNPCALVSLPASDAVERDMLEAEEINQLLRYLAKRPDDQEWLLLTLLGVCTGQRLSDCTGALWSNIERNETAWVWRIAQRKTKTRVEIPIVPPLLTLLNNIHPVSLWVLPTLSQMSASAVSKGFLRRLRAAGVDPDKQTKTGSGRGMVKKSFHSLRHSCNSIMANAGVSQDVRRSILGHASDRMNTHYTHLHLETSRLAIEKAVQAAGL